MNGWIALILSFITICAYISVRLNHLSNYGVILVFIGIVVVSIGALVL